VILNSGALMLLELAVNEVTKVSDHIVAVMEI
jgi:hypothetical protein